MSLELYEIIEKIIEEKLKYFTPQRCQVIKIEDPEQKGRVLCSVPAYGWDTEENAIWCYPLMSKSFVIPEVDDYGIIIFESGKVDNTGYYLGTSYDMKDMILSEYDGQTTTKVLIQSKDLTIKYDENINKYDIILNDNNISIDDNEKIITITDGSNYYKMDKNAGEITLENTAGNTITMSAANITITGPTGKLEVL